MAAAALLAGAAHAADRVVVRPTLEVSEEYTSNALSDESDERSDTLTRVNPALTFSSESETGHTRLTLGAQTRLHADFDDLNAADPFARFDVDRQLSDRWALFGDGSFASREEIDPVDEGGELLQGRRPDLDKLDWSGGGRFLFDARSSLSASFQREDLEYGDDILTGRSQRDRDTNRWAASYRRLLSPRDEFNLSYIQEESAFSSLPQQGIRPGSARTGIDEDVWLIHGTWSRSWSPTWSSRLSGGTRKLTSTGSGITFFRAAGRPRDQLAHDDSSYGFVGGLSLTRLTQVSRLELGFDAQTRPSSGQTGSLDIQSFAIEYARRLTDSMTLTIGGSWSDLQSASESFVVSVIDPITDDDLEALFSEEFLMGLDEMMRQALLDRLNLAQLLACPARGGVLGRVGTGAIRLGPNLDFLIGAETACADVRDNEVDTRVRRASVRLSWQLRKGWVATLGYELRDQSASGLTGQDHVEHRFRVGFRWNFELDVP